MSGQEILGKVLSLHVYPIKGCQPVNITTAVTTTRGFPYDRYWVIVDDTTNKAITQRNVPKMAIIGTDIPAEVFTGGPPPPDAALTITLPSPDGNQTITIPLSKSNQPKKEIEVRSWSGQAADEGDEAAEKLSAFFGEPMRLYRYLDGHPIPVDAVFAAGFDRAFSDGFPYLVINTKSYQQLQSAIGDPIEMNRFRANVVIDAQNAWEEDDWRQIQTCTPDGQAPLLKHLQPFAFSGLDKGPVFEFVKPCKRCRVTTVNQSTGIMGIQPLQILKECRNGGNTGFAVYMPKTKQATFFGWDAVSLGEKRVSVNDHVCLLQQGTWVLKRTWYQYAKEKLSWLWA